jgi:hypothetical protein
VGVLNRLAFELAHTLRTRPWVRMLIGAALIALGVLELFLGAGHGRIIAFGVLLLIGSAAAARGRRTHHDDHPGLDSDGDDPARTLPDKPTQ